TTGKPLRELARIRSSEHYISRKHRTDDSAIVVGNILVAQVQYVRGESQRRVFAERSDERKSVSDSRDRSGVMDCELSLVLSPERSRIPPDPFATRLRGDHRLPHPHCLCPRWKEQEQ